MQDRTNHVQDFLSHRLAPVCRLDIYPADTWQGSPFGWDPPFMHEGLFVFRYCPDLIASHTAKLFGDDVDDYLMAIVSCAFLHVIHSDVPDEERTRVVESVLYDTAPGSVELLSSVEAAALDRK
jgi:hypothetical protein